MALSKSWAKMHALGTKFGDSIEFPCASALLVSSASSLLFHGGTMVFEQQPGLDNEGITNSGDRTWPVSWTFEDGFKHPMFAPCDCDLSRAGE